MIVSAILAILWIWIGIVLLALGTMMIGEIARGPYISPQTPDPTTQIIKFSVATFCLSGGIFLIVTGVAKAAMVIIK